jgi:putative peptidoglycan lipid II flippase
MVALVVLGLPMIQVLFQRGKFDIIASLITNKALLYYSLGLPAYAISKILANTFFSFQNTKTPVKIAFVVMFIHVLLCIMLMKPLGVGGLALATAICAYINALMLLYKLRIKIGQIGIYKILNSTLKTVIASVIMGIICYLILQLKISIFISLTLAIIIGLIIFIISSKLLKSPEIEQLLSAFLRKYNAKNS